MNWRQRRKVRRSYRRIAGADELIDYQDWKSALSVKSDFLAKRLFTVIDADASGYIDFNEYQSFLSGLQGEERLSLLFRCYDVDDDGKLTREELSTILTTSLAEQKLSMSEEILNEMVQSLLDAAQVNKHSLNPQDFARLFETYPEMTRQIDRFVNQLIGNSKQKTKSNKPMASMLKRWGASLRLNFIPYVWAGGYAFVNLYLFLNAMEVYAQSGASLAVQLARGGGACLNLNAALILLPMMRGIMSGLRHSKLAILLPLDHLTSIHKMIGYACILFTVIHVGAHITNYIQTEQDVVIALSQTLVGVTGVVITLSLLFMWWTAQRRQKKYERFVLTHLLYAPFLVALLYHGPSFWLWLAPIGSLFLLDGLLRLVFRYRRVDVTELKALSERVTAVKFKRGRHFKFVPGDYVRIRIPEISRWQWHPFTLSAAPESDRLSVHVQSAGNWSAALNNIANQPHKERQQWKAYIDGPYAAPTSSFYRAPIAVLVAGGIGVTPFASVIQSALKSSDKSPEHLYFF